MIEISKDIAQKLCEEIRQENRGKWYTFNGLWCWGCARQAKGDTSKMCFSSRPDMRGCFQVNKRYAWRIRH